MLCSGVRKLVMEFNKQSSGFWALTTTPHNPIQASLQNLQAETSISIKIFKYQSTIQI